MKTIQTVRIAALLLILLCFSIRNKAQESQIAVIKLDKDWSLEPVGDWSADGKQVQPAGEKAQTRISCDVPTTVLNALVTAGKVKDPYFSDNMERIPRDWFKSGWKYSKTVEVDDALVKSQARLCLDGINYRADVILNGKKIASQDTLKGAFRRFEMNITGKLIKGKNQLEIIVFPPKAGDFTIGFVDWTPHVPDQNMGLWRGVSIRFNGPVSVNNPFVISKVNSGNQQQAALTIRATAVNHTAAEVNTTIRVEFENVKLSQDISLKPFQKKELVWEPAKYPELNLKNAKLWWPVGMGDPNLYKMQLSAIVKKQLSDKVARTFGIREVTSRINESGSRMYTINGRDLQIRGGGWSNNLYLEENPDNLEAQVLYTRLMHLNCIRMEGFWGTNDKIYDLCDQYGILLMTGWSCQWEWDEYVGKKCDQFGGISTPEEFDLITRSLKDHVMWLRNHPSIFVWVLGSDKLPRPELEKRYVSDLSVSDPSRPVLFACSARKSPVTGNTGVKMNGPYDYVSPNYWYLDTKNGGGFGFNTETGPGPQIPPVETLRKMFPEDKLWPINDIWNYHCGRNQFNTLKNYLDALNQRYGESSNLDEFVMKAQLANYEAIRPMFEAFAINKAAAGGIIQWMLNAPWPKLYWQLYDYYLTPNSAFFGTQNALKPLNIIYNYGNNGIYVSNDNLQGYNDLKAEIVLLDIHSKELLHKELPLKVEAYKSIQIFTLPEISADSSVYFADLRIKSADNMEISHSFYWLSSKKDEPDFPKTEWYITPLKGFADFKQLQALPKVQLEKSVILTKESTGEFTAKVSLKNPSDKLAFFVEMKARRKTSQELVLPVYWEDNYISLLPGESRTIAVKMNAKDLAGEELQIDVKGFNCQ